jgi:carboxypeptidase C (cathepsin A)
MLALGPKRLSVPQDPQAPVVEPTPVVDNTSSVLDVADLVFIDPAETGFSRVLPAGKRADFYSTDGDARSIASFVEQWTHAHGREKSPKYVLGESYGTIRAALMAGMLAERMPLDGVILFGQAVNMIETSQRASNAVAYATNLPALATIAAYHGRAQRGRKTMSAFIDDVYRWSMSEYLAALIAGRDLPASRQQRIARHLQQLTGISAEYYLGHDLVITKVGFARELLKDRNLVLGQYDARYTGPAPGEGERGADPFAKIIQPVLPSLRQYLSESLSVTLPMSDYRDFAPETSSWVWKPTGGIGGPFLDYNYPSELSKAFAANPRFRLMIGTGIYDLTTTVGPARYMVAKSDYPADRVFQRQYEGGHMAYTNEAALAAFTSDLRAFVTGKALARQ